MPLARTWSFALLWALSGLVAWPLRAADADVPLDFTKETVAQDSRRTLEYLGYRFDSKTGHVLGPDGQALTAARYRDYLAPYDFHKNPVTDEERAELLLGGCRFDEDSGNILCLDEKTKAKTLFSKLYFEYLRKQDLLFDRHEILERLSLLLSRQPADKPVPAETVAQTKAMLAKSPAGALPDSLVQALTAPGAKSGDVSAQVEKAYADSTRFFDGQTPLGERLKSVLSVVPGFNEPKRPPQYSDDTEKNLGDSLRDTAQQHFGQSPVGRELLDHFKDKDGEVRLPPFLILNIDPRTGAVYSYQNKTVVANQQYVVDGITAGLPPAERDALREKLKDSKKFAQYLLAHPEAREAFFRHYDGVLFHELTHAWQDRRDRIFDEMGRGNSPSAIHLEYEHEAFLQQMRYMHWKMLHDPASVKDDPWLYSYMGMVVDFDKWRDGISQQYYTLFPKDAATIATVQDLQKQRVSTARRLMGEGPYERITGWLKLFGMYRGNKELAKVKTEHQKRLEDFLKNEYPQMRRDGYGGIVEVFLLKAEDAKTPAEREDHLDTAEAYAKALDDPLLLERVRRARERKQ